MLLTNRLVLLSVLLFLARVWLAGDPVFGQSNAESELEHHSKAAGEAMRRSDYATAEREYLAVVHLAPKMAEAWSNLGLANYLQKQYDLAAERFQRALELKPSLVAPYYFLGRDRHAQRRFSDAVPLLEHAVALQPRNCEIRRQLGASLLALKELLPAMEQYRFCLQEDSRDMEALYHLGLISTTLARQAFDRVGDLPASPFSYLIKANHHISQAAWDQSEQAKWRQTARVEYLRALEMAPNLPEVRMSLGDLELQDQNWESASSFFEGELTRDPSSFLSHFGLAQTSLQKQDWSGTLQHLNQAASIRPEFFESLPDFKIALPKEKLAAISTKIQEGGEAGDFGHVFLLWIIEHELGNSSAADAAQEKVRAAVDVLKAEMDSASSSVGTEPDQIKGSRLLSQRRYEAGTELLLPLAQKIDADPDLQLTVAKALASTKRYIEGAALLELYVARRRDDPEAYYFLGVCYQNAATNHLQAMLAIDPQSYRLHWFLGDAYFEEERYDDATREYQAALNLVPGNSYLFLNLGNVLFRQMKYAEAADSFRRAADSDPQNSQAHLLLGDSLLLQRNPEEAIPHLRTALRIDPSLLQAHEKLGKAFAMLNRFQDAVSELELAAALDKDGSLHYQLGTYYRKLGREDKVVIAFAKSQELREQKLKTQQIQTMDSGPGGRERGSNFENHPN